MNNPDLSTVAAGQMRDQMKRNIEIRIHQPPELTTRLKVAEACEWIRAGASGRALEVLEELMAEFERADRDKAAEIPAQWAMYDKTELLPCGCPREMRSLCPHGNSDLA